MALKGRRWWWYAVAAVLILACLVAPGDDEVGRLLLPLAWLWPVLIWSASGVREVRYRVAVLPWYCLGLTAVLLALAALGRWRQIRG